MSTYKVKSNLKHDGKVYSKGDTVELSEEVAKGLLKDRVIVDLGGDVEDEERTAPQAPVNVVKREGDDVNGDVSVEPGKETKPQPGDEVNDDEGGEGEGDGEGNDAGEGEGTDTENPGDNL